MNIRTKIRAALRRPPIATALIGAGAFALFGAGLGAISGFAGLADGEGPGHVAASIIGTSLFFAQMGAGFGVLSALITVFPDIDVDEPTDAVETAPQVAPTGRGRTRSRLPDVDTTHRWAGYWLRCADWADHLHDVINAAGRSAHADLGRTASHLEGRLHYVDRLAWRAYEQKVSLGTRRNIERELVVLERSFETSVRDAVAKVVAHRSGPNLAPVNEKLDLLAAELARLRTHR